MLFFKKPSMLPVSEWAALTMNELPLGNTLMHYWGEYASPYPQAS